MYDFDWYRIELLCWDNEGEGGEGGDAGAGEGGDAGAGEGGDAGAGAGSGSGEGGDGKTFTQDDVNRIVAERNKKLKKQHEDLEQSYKDLLSKKNLTDGERADLEGKLERVRQEMMTKEQRLEAEKKKAQKEYETNLQAAQEESAKWKGLYENSTIERAITDAAATNDAFNPTHFIAHLAPKSQMVPEVDGEGNETGKLVPRVEWTSVDDKGVKHTSMLAPEEAIKKMKENVVEFGNLFKTNVAAGIGAGTAPGQVPSAGEVDLKSLTTEQYMEMAKTPEGRKRLGIAR